MKRDMELIRKILLAIEEQYVDVAIYDLKVENHELKEIAYHCKILHEAGLISNYDGHYASNELYGFNVGSLTWQGNEFLDKIRNDSIWNKTKETITKKGLPMVIDVVKEVATAIIAGMVQGAV